MQPRGTSSSSCAARDAPRTLFTTFGAPCRSPVRSNKRRPGILGQAGAGIKREGTLSVTACVDKKRFVGAVFATDPRPHCENVIPLIP